MSFWKHATKFKGQEFICGAEYSKAKGKRVHKLSNRRTGRELKEEYGNAQAMFKAGWIHQK